MHISAQELARFGLLFLNRGKWNGNQLISAEWVEQATSAQVDAFVPPYKRRAWYTSLIGAYGFNWWVNGMKRDGKRMWSQAPPKPAAVQGNHNNYCFVVPEWDMVIVRLGTDRPINSNLYNNFFAKLKMAFKNKKNTPD